MSDQKNVEKPVYTAPKLTVVGSIHEVTQAKVWGKSDGFALLSGELTNTSP